MKFLKNAIRSFGVVLATAVVTSSATNLPPITQEQKDILLAKLQPVMDKFFKNTAFPTAKDMPAMALGDKGDAIAKADKKGGKISQECLNDLENSSYAAGMNDIFSDYYPVVTSDNPVWTSWLLITSLLLAELQQSFPDSSVIPWGLCATDNKGKISCDAAALPYAFEYLSGIAGYLYHFYSYVPKYACLDQGGSIVRTSFSTTCMTEYIPDYPEIEFFGIPQCVPASCREGEIDEYWKNQIETDFEEMGFELNKSCKVKFKIDTKLPKAPKSLKNRKLMRGKP